MAWVQAADDWMQWPEGSLRRVRMGDRWLALARIGQTVYAFDDTCPHMEESLAEGELDGWVVYCPMHQSGFDVRTGAVINPPAESPIAVYPVRLEGPAVWVEVPTKAP